MTLKLTDELRQALQDGEGAPVEVHDELTHQVYVIVSRDRIEQLFEERLHQELQVGVDQIAAGDVGDWDIEEMIAEAHRRHELRSRS